MDASLLPIVLIAAFYVIQAAVTGYALARGGMPEQIAGGMLLAAAVASMTAQLLTKMDFQHVNVALTVIDALLMALLITIALFADRFWPMWLAALQIVTVASHGVRAYDPEIVPLAYWLIVGKIAYPMLALLLIGTIRHRDRMRAGLREHDWTPQRMKDRHERGSAVSPPEQAPT